MPGEDDLYISYARTDGRGVVKSCYDAMHGFGIRASFEARAHTTATDLDSRIEQAVSQATALAVCLTPGVLQQPDERLRREIIYAQLLEKPIALLHHPSYRARHLPPLLAHLDVISFYNRALKEDFRAGARRLLDWYQQERRFVPGPLHDVPQYGYLARLYQQIVAYLQAVFITSPVPLLYAIPIGSDELGIHRHALSDEIFEYLDDFSNAFEYLQSRAIMAGEADTGKTVTLLAYARHAIMNRLEDGTQPLPILASAATWPPFSRQPLSEWLAHLTGLDEVRVADLVDEGQIFLLVDHLHYLGTHQEDLPSCLIQLIRSYIEGDSTGSGWLPQRPLRHNQVLISGRIRDLGLLSAQLNDIGLITLQPLSDEQIEDYLVPYPDLQAAVFDTPLGLDLSRNLFFLSLLCQLFELRPGVLRKLQAFASDLKDLQRYLLSLYIEEKHQTLNGTHFALEALHHYAGQLAIIGIMQSHLHGNNPLSAGVNRASIAESLGEGLTAQLLDELCALDLIVEVPGTPDTVQFIHPDLRDFLAEKLCLNSLEQTGSVLNKRQAIWILGELGSRDAVPAVIDHLLQASQLALRREAAIALGKIGDLRALDPLEYAMGNDVHWMVRQKSVEALGQLGGLSIAAILRMGLNDDNGNVRASALKQLVQVGGISMLDELMGYLSDEDPGVRWQAANAIAELGESAIDPLLEVLVNVDLDAYQGAIEALGLMGEQAVEPLLAALRRGPPELRRGVGESLVKIGEKALPWLLREIDAGNTNTKAMVATILGEIGHADALPSLIDLIDHPNPWVRINVTYALGEIKDERAIPVLEPLLADTTEPFYNERICNIAADALWKIGTPEAQGLVEDWRRHSYPLEDD
ncbi:MAG: HEAT repeat domain-containing protein [Chloroflexi bacterium]|nr:HEAT repeat domain-containing protein [Chloroflexota bacterium]